MPFDRDMKNETFRPKTRKLSIFSNYPTQYLKMGCLIPKCLICVEQIKNFGGYVGNIKSLAIK